MVAIVIAGTGALSLSLSLSRAPGIAAQAEGAWWRDVSATHLPAGMAVGRSSMASELVDLDGDGDLDVVLAVEFGTNVVLRNDGEGRFADATPPDLLLAAHDSEDVAVADFDGDGHLDLVFVAEDDRRDEYYLGDGAGGFVTAPWPIPTDDVSNAVLAIDFDEDGDLDLVVGNHGQNAALRNDGGRFVNVTSEHLPESARITQDIVAGDVDGDGDLDLVEGNEDGNRILHNDGTGRFSVPADPELRYPPRAGGEETRVVALADVDGDGNLDLLVANVVWSGLPGGNRLLLGDGAGRFADATAGRLPQEHANSIDIETADVDADGALDLLVANAFLGPDSWRLLTGDGRGTFTDVSALRLPRPMTGNGIDVDAADLDGDGRLDLYMANHGGRDRLLLSSEPGTPATPATPASPAPTATASATSSVTSLPPTEPATSPTPTALASPSPPPTEPATPTAGPEPDRRVWLPVVWRDGG